jgi:hypothetical protein
MKHVKGSMLTKVVKIIKSDKSGVYDNLLLEEDKEILSGTILSATWYPYDFYKRAINALAQVYAKDDMEEVVRQWGHVEGEEMIQSVYKTVLREKNYKVAMKKWELFFKHFYDFGEMVIHFISDKEMEVVFKEFDPDNKVFYCLAQGWTEKILEICECKDLSSKFLVKSWEGAGDTKLHFLWTS